MKKYIVIFSVIITAFLTVSFLVLGSVSADQQAIPSGNFKYIKTAHGVEIIGIHSNASSTKKQNLPQGTNNQTNAQSQFLNITSVASIPDINVAYGTDLSSINLPVKVIATMSNGATKKSPILWDSGTPTYDPNSAGTYVFSGVPVVSGNFTNTNDIKTEVNVIVSPQSSASQQPPQPTTPPSTPTPPASTTSTSQTLNIASVAPISDIDIATGTASSAIGLPTTVGVTLSDSSTSTLPVVWDGGNPAYDGNTVGTYVFTGTLTLPDGITNSSNLTASVNVVEAVQSASTENSTSSLEQTTSPSNGTASIYNAGSDLIHLVGQFINFIFSPLKLLHF